MGNSVQTDPILRFQDFQVNLNTGELWRAGIRLKLQDQPFKVLSTLLQRPGQVVGREELRQLIWPNESFGDFDHAINLAVNKLRSTLGDSADVPHFIETLPRRGYRFIAPIEGQSVPLHPTKVLPRVGARKRFWLMSGISACILFGAAFFSVLTRRAQRSSTAVEVLPLVSMPGEQSDPAISPDGNQVAFRFSGGQHPGIYIALVGGEKPLQLTDDADDSNPSWSPDGKQIVFVRNSERQRILYVIPALGGSARRLYSASLPALPHCERIDWSPNGKWLIFAESLDDGDKARLDLLSLSDLTAQPLTFPGNQQFDCDPSFSPDGASVAFVRGLMGGLIGDLFVARVDGGTEPLRLTSGNSGGDPTWTPDGSEIVFSSPIKGIRSLWRISASGGKPQRVAGAGGDVWSPSISRRGTQLAYWVWKQWDTVWRLDLKDERHPLGPPVRLLSGRGIVWRPSISPDGKKVVFESDRMGYSDIWMCDIDGSNCSQLTAMQGLSGTARFSPNGRYVSFESIQNGNYEAYVTEVPDGMPHVLKTFAGVNNGAPNWSRDGHWIYFYSGLDKGIYQLWKIPSGGGQPVRITTNGGIYAIESLDGQFLYYSKFPEPGVWKKTLQGGDESRVPINVCCWFGWDVGRTGIYFLNLAVPPNGRIEFFDFATQQSTPILSLEKPASLYGGLNISPDGKFLLYGQNELDESYIMIVKNFR